MAYVNATINEGGFGSFIATEAITLYQRVKFVTTALAAGDGKVGLAVAGIAERGDAIAMQPIASGDFGTVRFLNAQGEQFGQATEAIALGGAVYTDALGNFSTTAGGGALLVGVATSAGYALGPFTWIPKIPAA
jgi:hypothetical protein